MDWTAGYVADIAYMSGYFGELNPAKVPMGLLNVGFAPPKIENACELGFGQGVTVAMHAAAQPHINRCPHWRNVSLVDPEGAFRVSGRQYHTTPVGPVRCLILDPNLEPAARECIDQLLVRGDRGAGDLS